MFGSKKTNFTPLVMGQEKFDTLIGWPSNMGRVCWA